MEFSQRKPIRLKGYDYSQNGAYFITICSNNRINLFGDIIVGQGLCSCRLTNVGNIIDDEINKLTKRYCGVKIDNYIIMPNHVHLLIFIQGEWQEQSPCPTVGDIICTLKSITTKRVNKIINIPERKIWQYRFHDHIVRNDEEYQEIWAYIQTNPSNWKNDRFYFTEN